jgi:hypothetical protein
MIEHSSRPYGVIAKINEVGMARFFSSANLDRYRKLASEAISDVERQQVLDMLAKEVSAFRHESKSQISSKRESCGLSSRELGYQE